MKTVLAQSHPDAVTTGWSEYLRPVLSAGLRCRFPGGAQVLVVLLFFTLIGALRTAYADEPAPLRFGFSSEVFSEVNESDVRAALKVWAQTIGIERGIPVDSSVKILTGVEAIKDALLNRKIDAITLTAVEFWSLRGSVPVGPMVLGSLNGVATEEYLLLVHRDNPATRAADLQGKSIGVLQGARASLVLIWLDTLLLEEHLPVAETFFGNTTRTGKLSRIVLPVFFRQVDACVVTRSGFRTMSELNPQVGRQLKILAESPAMVPSLYFYRGDLVSPYADKMLADINQIGKTTAGQQTLMLFQSGELNVRPVSDMASAWELLDRHQFLLAEAAKAKPADAGTPASDGEGRSP